MAEAGPTTITPCPVAPLAREAARQVRYHAYFEMRDPQLHDQARRRLEEIEQAASRLKADSGEGALLQVMVAYALVEWLVNDHTGEKDEAAKALLARINGCLEGAANALRTVETLPLFDWYMTRAFEAQGIAA